MTDADGEALRKQNRPGLPAIQYRLRTWATFRQRMLARVPSQAIPDGVNAGARPLASLKTRSDDDPTIALLDAWALAGDVITFYQERIANEGYLRTATERRSALELARAVGYQPRPAAAAETFLAFTVEDGPASSGRVQLAPGVQAMSLPAQDQLPRVFETVEALEARADWNEMRPLRRRLAPPRAGDTRILLAGLMTGLTRGSYLLFLDAPRVQERDWGAWDLRRVLDVETDSANGYSRVTLDAPISSRAEEPFRDAPLEVHALRMRAQPFGHNAPYPPRSEGSPPDWPDLALVESGASDAQHGEQVVLLEGAHPTLFAGTWIVALAPGGVCVARVERTKEVIARRFGLVAACTRLAVGGDDLRELDAVVRDVTILAGSEPLAPAMCPIEAPVEGRSVQLDRVVPGLRSGRRVSISGRRVRVRAGPAASGLHLVSAHDVKREVPIMLGDTLRVASAPQPVPPHLVRWHLEDLTGFLGSVVAPAGAFTLEPALPSDPPASAVRTIVGVSQDNEPTVLTLDEPLDALFDRESVTLCANVARATEGETVEEVLGSGEGSASRQRFVLRKTPLTHVPSPDGHGLVPALEVRVDDVLWRRAENLRELGPTSQAYILQIEDDGTTSVVFGDGVNGARLPTGQDNVRARYRSGGGLDGQVAANTIALLLSRPLGLKDVTNPLAASGGADPEPIERVKEHTPYAARTLGRIVSLLDHEDFARTFPGIGKARVDLLRDGERSQVHVTVSDERGASPPPRGALLTNLLAAMRRSSAGAHDISVSGYTLKLFRLEASIVVKPRYEPAAVLAAARAAFEATYAFERRSFAERITASEVVAAIHRVPGVEAVDLDRLYYAHDLAGPSQRPAHRLDAAPARLRDGVPHPAEILVLDVHGYSIRIKEAEP